MWLHLSSYNSKKRANAAFASRTSALLETLQVPDDQACLKAEGKVYDNSHGETVQAVQYSTSGCIVALDRLATWINGLSLADNSS